ncbi:hypothetical protein RJ641_009924 [Dillenia turbinata]|uniref:Beta-galactosidase galactose-binding domain-containing protein n=1 Tax=Dillenia turbinata TaxID=194707 RepID=A0AAN8UZK3_9MAGN
MSGKTAVSVVVCMFVYWVLLKLEVNTSCIKPLLHVESNGHVVQVFLNNIYMGVAHGSHDKKSFSFESSVTLDSHIIDISILNTLVGLPDSGAYLERKFAGLTKVRVHCSDNEYDEDFSNQTWGYQVGLLGERQQIYKEENLDVVKWSKMEGSTYEPLTWYKTLFDAPQGNDPVALNMTTMGKGEIWINGQSIGRYWITFLTPEGNPSQTM